MLIGLAIGVCVLCVAAETNDRTTKNIHVSYIVSNHDIAGALTVNSPVRSMNYQSQ